MEKDLIGKRNSFARVGIRAANLKGKDVSSNEVREDLVIPIKLKWIILIINATFL